MTLKSLFITFVRVLHFSEYLKIYTILKSNPSLKKYFYRIQLKLKMKYSEENMSFLSTYFENLKCGI